MYKLTSCTLILILFLCLLSMGKQQEEGSCCAQMADRSSDSIRSSQGQSGLLHSMLMQSGAVVDLSHCAPCKVISSCFGASFMPKHSADLVPTKFHSPSAFANGNRNWNAQMCQIRPLVSPTMGPSSW